MTSTSTLSLLTDYLDEPNPTVEQAQQVFTPLTVGDYDDVHIAALLTMIRTRGETFADLLGAARAFLAAGRPFPITGAGILDTAGTGGDGQNTINITTGASLVAAAGGAKMIKCGNRSVSSRSGSADVLEAMNIPLDLDPERAVRQFRASNFTFLFAPAYNPAISHVQPVRRALKIPTLFNTLGPVLSPARPEYQIMGVANPSVGRMIAEVFRELGRGRALVVHGSGTDEVAVWGPTTVWELTRSGEISEYTIHPEELGLDTYALSELAGGDGPTNARHLYAAFDGTGSPAHIAAIAASAGAMFYISDAADSLREGVDRARALMADGTVSQWLATHEEADYAH
ncbi:anthranilate phosphoribosyltransferase [Corynebacterium uberis]|uniref:anthranilate phosphoribosyltransferase n=1 Tax=Corynebacterium TaxID=1716 RepID=UPI001D0A573E|nr:MULTISPECIES: anthranilate phosphoribosyltransferase [Corynebacterium]MCZ9310177.1 anthranilate phosphoribosyltransferase [Corynebacterium sp. c6VSa_13]UDL73315.1 anthranilate phosphoribosyltransferase [Corynebacterium uberis]UDL75807.1 anthranilate phosphoribosyltransferase [Corynebacterium uberis]UDL78020.1 anthranilate phosphoribosyltransferase [Corynebacterium uberis]UDL80302.1 anthranilate phosphoribosyltransferase [Corynebacterium uberis]